MIVEFDTTKYPKSLNKLTYKMFYIGESMDITRENILSELHERKTRMNNDSLRVKALQQMLDDISNSTVEKRLEKITKEALADAIANYLGPAHIIDTVISMIKKDGLLRDED